MTEKKPKNDASHVLLAERERTLASAIRRRSRYINFLDRAFQEAGCSCSPYRSQLDELETRYRSEKDRLIQELDNSDLANEISGLKMTISEIDLREHLSLDKDARHAYPFLAVWMLDQVRVGNSEILGLSDTEIAGSYANAWYVGWRPKSLYGREKLKESNS